MDITVAFKAAHLLQDLLLIWVLPANLLRDAVAGSLHGRFDDLLIGQSGRGQNDHRRRRTFGPRLRFRDLGASRALRQYQLFDLCSQLVSGPLSAILTLIVGVSHLEALFLEVRSGSHGYFTISFTQTSTLTGLRSFVNMSSFACRSVG